VRDSKRGASPDDLSRQKRSRKVVHHPSMKFRKVRNVTRKKAAHSDCCSLTESHASLLHFVPTVKHLRTNEEQRSHSRYRQTTEKRSNLDDPIFPGQYVPYQTSHPEFANKSATTFPTLHSMTFTPTTMAGLKRSLKCDDLLTMTISQQQSGKESSCRSMSSLSCSGSSSSTGLDSLNEQQSLVLISQFVQLRTTSSGSSPSKRQRSTNKNPATAALECLEASWDYRSFQTAVAMMSN
jgi:hypothetical protein